MIIKIEKALVSMIGTYNLTKDSIVNASQVLKNQPRYNFHLTPKLATLFSARDIRFDYATLLRYDTKITPTGIVKEFKQLKHILEYEDKEDAAKWAYDHNPLLCYFAEKIYPLLNFNQMPGLYLTHDYKGALSTKGYLGHILPENRNVTIERAERNTLIEEEIKELHKQIPQGTRGYV